MSSISNTLEHLKIDVIGHAQHLQKGTEHTTETLWVELIDNSDKAIKIRREQDINFIPKINLYINEDYYAISDNGIGINGQTLERLLSNYKISRDSVNGMSKSGIGFNTVVANFLTENNICIILSKSIEPGESIDDATHISSLLVKTDEGVKFCPIEYMPRELIIGKRTTRDCYVWVC